MKLLNEIVKTKKAVMSFGRMNPPTIGHEKLINKLLSTANSTNSTPFLFLSQTQDSRKNPLSSKDKEKYISLGVPKISKNIVNDSSIKTPFDAIKLLEHMGYTDIVMVVGQDRVGEFKKVIGKYLNHPDPLKSLNLQSFNVISAGDRDPDSDLVFGMSASKMRDFARRNDFNSFKEGTPSKLSLKYQKELFDKIRKSIRIAEMVESIQKLTNTLNIPRSEMPQIKEQDIQNFLEYLKNNNVKITRKKILVNFLLPTQNEINLEKVKEKSEKISNNIGIIKPFIVSSDNHILDGHHQLYALKSLDENIKVDCVSVDITISELLLYAQSYPKTYKKTINDKIISNKKESNMKTLNDILQEADVPTVTDRVKEKQEREKEQLSIKHSRELERAKEQDFENKQNEVRQKEKEKLIKKSTD